ncbi:hypothetical protein HFO55_05020 [Rhizobium leguminosarum]|uniref:hypothetical protein n=1 Tax=Rhizobium leguminosarum TaxID=384 RepID=UPI001C956C5A|nr:hypothetical protein [Rhizobium leguminosarum]MBY5566617.1 hypothetical protein [Rhizobium leguminosarum]MBY5573895.1 hypothetical protein [Rhizobium leguminosarum]
MKSFMIIAVLGAVTAGCQTAVPQSVADTQRPPSKTLRSTIVKAARDFLLDPYSVRDAEISNVVLFNPQARIEAVCVKANAKNGYGGYSGRQATSVSLRDGIILGATTNDVRCLDPRLGYYPFKELENLKNL